MGVQSEYYVALMWRVKSISLRGKSAPKNARQTAFPRGVTRTSARANTRARPPARSRRSWSWSRTSRVSHRSLQASSIANSLDLPKISEYTRTMSTVAATLSSRAAVSLDARRAKAAKVNTTVRAATHWVLDGRNCAGARTGDVGTFKSNIVSRIKCPVTPIAVTDLCEQHKGRFVMLDAIFEQEGPDLYIYSHKPGGCVPIPNPAKRLAHRARVVRPL